MTDQRPLHERVAEILANPRSVFLPDDVRTACEAVVALEVTSYDAGHVFVAGPPRRARTIVSFEPAEAAHA